MNIQSSLRDIQKFNPSPPGDQSASHLSAAKAATSDLNICLGFKKELHHYTSRRDFYRFSPQLLLLEKRLYTVSQKRYFLNFVCIVGAYLNPLCNPARDTALAGYLVQAPISSAKSSNSEITFFWNTRYLFVDVFLNLRFTRPLQIQPHEIDRTQHEYILDTCIE